MDLEKLQVCYRNNRTGVQIACTPQYKYIQAKKSTKMSCLFALSSRESSLEPARLPVEIALCLLSNRTNEEYLKNTSRGVKKIFKYLSNEKKDKLHLVGCEEEPMIYKENILLGNSNKEGLTSLLENSFSKKKVSNENALKTVECCFDVLLRNGENNSLKRIILFWDMNTPLKKKQKKGFIDLVKQTYLKKGISISIIAFGEEFDEDFVDDIAKNGCGYYHFAKEELDIPKKASKEIHSITDQLLGRKCVLRITANNGTKFSTDSIKMLYDQKKNSPNLDLYFGTIIKKNLKKVLIDIEVKPEDIKNSEFLNFNLKFIPADCKEKDFVELSGKLRLYVSKDPRQINTEEKNELFLMAKNILSFSELNQGIRSLIVKKNLEKAKEKQRESQRKLTKFLGKDPTGHVDKLIRVLFWLKEELNKKNSKKRLSKSYHYSSVVIEQDQDYGYNSGKDSDFGCWDDIKNETETESESNDEDEDEFLSGEEEMDDDGFDEDDEFNIDDDDEFNIDDDDLEQEDEFSGVIQEVETETNNAIVVDEIKMVLEQQKTVKEISSILDINLGAAGSLLKHFKWNTEKIYQQLDNKEQLFKNANLRITKTPFYQGKKKEMECPICYDDFPGEKMYSLACGHWFCEDCWKNYLIVNVEYGPSCLMAKCPHVNCGDICVEELFFKMLDEKSKERYNRYLLRSFVDDNPKIKWCPAPDCGKAVYCPNQKMENVVCSCGQKFCFKCQREAHEPSSCKELADWKRKEKDESETANWLTVNTKICPGCDKPIEKNGGCNHMTCAQCKHEFCWICMDPWSQHGSKTGGFYSCNKYNPDDLKKKLKSDKLNEARAALEKYSHYFKRYAVHLNSQKFEDQLKLKCEEKMKDLQLKKKFGSWGDVEFVQKGIEQLCECRRVLKYTYIHAYYLENEQVKTLFEFMQDDLERETEKLSGLLEQEIEKFKREEIIASYKSAKKRLDHLLEGCRQGLIQQ